MRAASFPFNETEEYMKQLAQTIKADLKRQVPQPGKNRYATGRLRDSLEVEQTKVNDTWTVGVSYPFYGNYTIYGTRPQDPDWLTEAQKGLFDLPNFQSYRPGKAGIRPQYWLSLSRKKNKYLKQLEAAVTEDYNSLISGMVENLSKPQ